MTLAQPVSISYRLGRCEPIIRADNDPTECGGGPDDRMVKAEAKAGSAPIRDDRRWSGGAFTKIQPRASVECARRCSWPAFPHTCTLAYTHAYTAPTGPLHHTDRSPTPHRPVHAGITPASLPQLILRAHPARKSCHSPSVFFLVPSGVVFIVNVALKRYCQRLR